MFSHRLWVHRRRYWNKKLFTIWNKKIKYTIFILLLKVSFCPELRAMYGLGLTVLQLWATIKKGPCLFKSYTILISLGLVGGFIACHSYHLRQSKAAGRIALLGRCLPSVCLSLTLSVFRSHAFLTLLPLSHRPPPPPAIPHPLYLIQSMWFSHWVI